MQEVSCSDEHRIRFLGIWKDGAYTLICNVSDANGGGVTDSIKSPTRRAALVAAFSSALWGFSKCGVLSPSTTSYLCSCGQPLLKKMRASDLASVAWGVAKAREGMVREGVWSRDERVEEFMVGVMKRAMSEKVSRQRGRIELSSMCLTLPMPFQVLPWLTPMEAGVLMWAFAKFTEGGGGKMAVDDLFDACLGVVENGLGDTNSQSIAVVLWATEKAGVGVDRGKAIFDR